MIVIQNNQACFVQLWLRLERTRQLLYRQCKRFCVRRVLKHRDLLRAIVSIKTGISYYKIDLKALDAAYSIAFPKSTPLNVNKKKR